VLKIECHGWGMLVERAVLEDVLEQKYRLYTCFG